MEIVSASCGNLTLYALERDADFLGRTSRDAHVKSVCVSITRGSEVFGPISLGTLRGVLLSGKRGVRKRFKLDREAFITIRDLFRRMVGINTPFLFRIRLNKAISKALLLN